MTNFLEHFFYGTTLVAVSVEKQLETLIMKGARHPYFSQSLVFCNHFEELQTMLFEVELIINNTPLIYVYPNNIETQLFVIWQTASIIF